MKGRSTAIRTLPVNRGVGVSPARIYGRDHWSWCSVLGLSGAGIKMGTVVGRTDKLCERPTDAVYNTHELCEIAHAA